MGMHKAKLNIYHMKVSQNWCDDTQPVVTPWNIKGIAVYFTTFVFFCGVFAMSLKWLFGKLYLDYLY